MFRVPVILLSCSFHFFHVPFMFLSFPFIVRFSFMSFRFLTCSGHFPFLFLSSSFHLLWFPGCVMLCRLNMYIELVNPQHIYHIAALCRFYASCPRNQQSNFGTHGNERRAESVHHNIYCLDLHVQHQTRICLIILSVRFPYMLNKKII